MTSGYSGTPDEYWALFGAETTPETLEVLDPDDRAAADFTHVFATELARLRDHLAAARDAMAEDGLVWVSWPKKSSGVETEVGKADVLREGKAAGLVDVKVAAVDETWSGHKFVIPVEDRDR